MPIMTIVNEKCGRCGHSLTGWIPKYYTIAAPFAKCSNCGAFNDRSNKATEWRLMTSERKTAIVFLTLFWGIAYSAVVWIVIGGAAMKLNPSIGDQTNWLAGEAGLTLAISLFVGIGGNYLWLLHQIRNSEARLADNGYAQTLKELNLLP